mmetsp:Transcript_14191/g.44368  ORF Transcript_14191/g.44368 Transcript_14191/m.44368 type:complete len:355 (-) Transcript_14191:138-1202(-)
MRLTAFSVRASCERQYARLRHTRGSRALAKRAQSLSLSPSAWRSLSRKATRNFMMRRKFSSESLSLALSVEMMSGMRLYTGELDLAASSEKKRRARPTTRGDSSSSLAAMSPMPPLTLSMSFRMRCVSTSSAFLRTPSVGSRRQAYTRAVHGSTTLGKRMARSPIATMQLERTAASGSACIVAHSVPMCASQKAPSMAISLARHSTADVRSAPSVASSSLLPHTCTTSGAKWPIRLTCPGVAAKISDSMPSRTWSMMASTGGAPVSALEGSSRPSLAAPSSSTFSRSSISRRTALAVSSTKMRWRRPPCASTKRKRASARVSTAARRLPSSPISSVAMVVSSPATSCSGAGCSA